MLTLNFVPFPSLLTERLLLRSLTIDDKNEIFAIRSDENMIKYLDRPSQKCIDEASQFIEKITHGVAQNRWIYWAVCLKDKKELIGTICIWNISEEESKAEVGFELLPAYQGKGLMREALTVVIDYGFYCISLNSLEGEVDPQNIKSIRLMEQSGFTQVNCLRETDSAAAKEGRTIIYRLEKS